MAQEYTRLNQQSIGTTVYEHTDVNTPCSCHREQRRISHQQNRKLERRSYSLCIAPCRIILVIEMQVIETYRPSWNRIIFL